jgi:hypothetical protein
MNATLCMLQEFLRSNINSIVPEPIASFHDELLRRYADTGTGSVIDEQRVVFGVKRSGHVFPLALFLRSGTDGVSVIAVLQAIIARDQFLLCSGSAHIITGVSEGTTSSLGVDASVGKRKRCKMMCM